MKRHDLVRLLTSVVFLLFALPRCIAHPAEQVIRPGERASVPQHAVGGGLHTPLGNATSLDPADSLWDGLFAPAGTNGTVFTVIAMGTDLYAGGSFTLAGTTDASNIARWNGSSWSALGTGTNGIVRCLAILGADLVAAGEFTTAGGDTVNRIARWDGTTWSPLGEGLNGTVHALAVVGNNVYAGGAFTVAGDDTAHRIARWDGTDWSSLGVGMNNPVYTLTVRDTDLYAGGGFTTAGAAAANRIARWDGSAWSPLGSGTNNNVSALAFLGTDLYAGGSFTTAGGVSAPRIARWDGASWSAVGAGVTNTVSELATMGKDLYAGGAFTTAGGGSANHIARWDGLSWSSLGSGTNDKVWGLAVIGNDLYVGGDFTTAGSTSSPHIARWLGGRYVPLFCATPETLAFGPVAVGDSSAKDITVKNTGLVPLAIDAVTSTNPDFHVLPLTSVVPAGDSAAFTVWFTPGALGPALTDLTFAHNAATSPDTVTATGTGGQPLFEIRPPILAFGDVGLGSSAVDSVSVRNTGTTSLRVDSARSYGGEFSVLPLGPELIDAGDSAWFAVTFSPTVAGLQQGHVVFSHNAAGSPDSVLVTGAGGLPQFTVAPSSIAFGNVGVGGTGSESTWVKNVGTGPLTVDSVRAYGGEFSVLPAGPAGIPAGDSLVFVVTFHPTTPDPQTGGIRFFHTAAGSPDTVTLSGTGVRPLFAVHPPNVAFGPVDVGDSLSRFVIVHNTGTAPLTVITTTSSNALFSIAPAGGTVPPEDSLAVTVEFKPVAVGPAAGIIVFTHNAAGSPDTVAVSGVGADTTTYLFLTMTPQEIFDMNPLRPGKSNKPAKRAKLGKPVNPLKNVPNRSNILSEIIAQGAFAPGTTEGDSAGGTVIGISHMERIEGKWKPQPDSAALRCWMRLTKWNPKKSPPVGKNHADLQKTLFDKILQFHSGRPKGLNCTTDGKNTMLRKQLRRLTPKKHDNRLLAELVALKVNIGASELGTTPVGFGDLIYENDGNAYDEMTILSISATADRMMTYWQVYDSTDYDELYEVIYDLNRAFPGSLPLDTLQFNAYIGESPVPLIVKGETALSTVSYLKRPVPFVVTTTPRLNGEVEAPEDFEEEESEEDEGFPAAARLYQNYPNPFNPGTTLSFRLPEASYVTVYVYNTLGQRVAALSEDEEMEEGYNELPFNATGLATGVYYYRIVAQGVGGSSQRSVLSGRMLLLK